MQECEPGTLMRFPACSGPELPDAPATAVRNACATQFVVAIATPRVHPPPPPRPTCGSKWLYGLALKPWLSIWARRSAS